jgi:hypothetical protein
LDRLVSPFGKLLLADKRAIASAKIKFDLLLGAAGAGDVPVD